MALMPKRVKHRKSQRGRIRGDASRGNRVVHGDFGLQAMQGGWISAQTLEAGRIAAQQGRSIELQPEAEALLVPDSAPDTGGVVFKAPLV